MPELEAWSGQNVYNLNRALSLDSSILSLISSLLYPNMRPVSFLDTSAPNIKKEATFVGLSNV